MFKKQTLTTLLIIASYEVSAIKLEAGRGRPRASDWNELADAELATGNYADCGSKAKNVLRTYYKKLLNAEYRYGENSRRPNEARYNREVDAATALKD